MLRRQKLITSNGSYSLCVFSIFIQREIINSYFMGYVEERKIVSRLKKEIYVTFRVGGTLTYIKYSHISLQLKIIYLLSWLKTMNEATGKGFRITRTFVLTFYCIRRRNMLLCSQEGMNNKIIFSILIVNVTRYIERSKKITYILKKGLRRNKRQE